MASGSGSESTSQTQVILDSLVQARYQKQKNDSLRNLCLDNESLLIKLHGQYNTMKQRLEISRGLQKATDLLLDFESNVSFSQLRKHHTEKYLEQCEQKMAAKDFTRFEDKNDVADLENVLQQLKQMKGIGDSAHHYTNQIDFGARLLEKCMNLLRDSKLQSKPFAQLMGPLMMLLKEVMHIGPIQNCLVEKEEEIRRMRFNVDECTQAQAQAISEGEMQEAETLYYQKLKLQELLSDLVKQKFALVDTEEIGAFQMPMRKVHETHNKANADLAAMLQDRDRVKKQCEQDLMRLTLRMEQCRAEDLTQTTAFNEEKEKSNEFLKANFDRQQECWKQIEQLERELQKLANDRMDEVKRRIQSVERNQRRRTEVDNFLSFANQHEKLLRLTMQNCEIAEEVTDTIDEFISSACNAIEKRMRETEKELEQLRVDIHNEYFHGFRDMYLTIGDLQYKKERHVQEIEKKIQSEQIQQEFCMETFNPKAKEHSQAKKALLAQKAEMETALGTLRGRSQLYIEWFKPSEKALIEFGIDFKHPVDELVELNQSRNHKLIEYHELMTAQEDTEDDYAAEMAEIERLRQLAAIESRSIARLTAGPSGTTPKAPIVAPSVEADIS